MSSRPSSFYNDSTTIAQLKGYGHKRRVRRRKNGTFSGHVRKSGPFSASEKEIIEEAVLSATEPIIGADVTALAYRLDRTPASVRAKIQEARAKFIDAADFYVESHRKAVAGALEHGSMDGMEIAVKGSQWAMEHLGAEGESIIDKTKNDPNTTQVMVGINFGAKNG